jgi:hypothetical protein
MRGTWLILLLVPITVCFKWDLRVYPKLLKLRFSELHTFWGFHKYDCPGMCRVYWGPEKKPFLSRFIFISHVDLDWDTPPLPLPRIWVTTFLVIWLHNITVSSYYLFRSWRQKQHVFPKRWYQPTRIHSGICCFGSPLNSSAFPNHAAKSRTYQRNGTSRGASFIELAVETKMWRCRALWQNLNGGADSEASLYLQAELR